MTPEEHAALNEELFQQALRAWGIAIIAIPRYLLWKLKVWIGWEK